MNRRSFLAVAAAAPFALSSPAARARLLGGTPLALVTADLEAHVVAVHVRGARVLLEHEVRVARSSHDACFLMGR